MNEIKFTQGDAALIVLFAEDEFGEPLDLTGATIVTKIAGKNSVTEFDNSKHTIVTAAQGKYTLNLSVADTAALESGSGMDVLSTVTQGGRPITYRGMGVLEVFPPAQAQAAAAQTNIFLGSGLGC